jgi:hypothetical protein
MRGTPPGPTTLFQHEQGDNYRNRRWSQIRLAAVDHHRGSRVWRLLDAYRRSWTVDRRPVPNPKMAHYATAEDAAKAVGATVTPTTPKPALEPVPAGPKPVQPAIPDQKRS